MAKYYDSDYARNKNSKNIIFKSVTGETIEITLEDLIKENPNMTVDELVDFKTKYVEMLRVEDIEGNRKTRLDSRLTEENQKILISSETPIDIIVDKIDSNMSKLENDEKIYSLIKLLSGTSLTKTQVKRGIMYFFDNLSYREIAEIEGVHYTKIKKSIDAISGKL